MESYRKRPWYAFQRRESNKNVIADTLAICERCETFFGPVKRPHVCILPATHSSWDYNLERSWDAKTTCRPVSVDILDIDCVAMAQELAKQPHNRVWMLNMASQRVPGGGARKGCNAQEEHICRCSNLLPQLESVEKRAYPLHGRQPEGIDFKVLLNERVVFFKDPDN